MQTKKVPVIMRSPPEGIQFWAVSFCRSTLGFYEGFAKAFDVPFRVCLARGGLGARGEIGFTEAEFEHLDLVVTEDAAQAAQALAERRDWLQLFGTYQKTDHIQATIRKALAEGCRVGIASEAPCNMEPSPLRRRAKAAYIARVLPRRVGDIATRSEFILNWSGDDAAGLAALGWRPDRIIPTGYFSPPLVGSRFVSRDAGFHAPFRILCSSSLTWHRGPDLLVEALEILTGWGIDYEATFTGSGPLEPAMRARADAAKLPVRFLGRVPMDELIGLYEGCSVFVAPGRAEPWGLRVNDAVNAGAPVVISSGMGAAKLVNDYGIGQVFNAGDVVDLAWQLRRLATDRARYVGLCDNLIASRSEFLPRVAAARAAGHVAGLLGSDSGRR
jgi:glycosyltransferase involved in cell wall biosynthesis